MTASTPNEALNQAIAAKERFLAAHPRSKFPALASGIGMTATGAYFLKAYSQDLALTAADLPTEFEGYPVVFEFIGAVTPLATAG